MANTTADKLKRLKNTKSKFINEFQKAGVEIPADLPFIDFPNYIGQLAPLPGDTTTLEDLMVLADLYYEVDKGLYEDKSYSVQEQTELMNLVDLILEGEE